MAAGEREHDDEEDGGGGEDGKGGLNSETEARASTDLAAAAALFLPSFLSQIPLETIQLRAQIEIMGLTPEAVGNRLASETNRFSTSNDSPVRPSTAPAFGEGPALAVPIWCAEMMVAPLPPLRMARGPNSFSIRLL